MNAVETVARLAPVFGTVIAIILGAQLWKIGSEKRKMAAETKKTDVDSAVAIGVAAVQLIHPYSRAFQLIDKWSVQVNRRIDVMEDYIDRTEDWQHHVLRKIRSGESDQIDPPPRRPDFGPRPAFHPLVDRGDDGTGGDDPVRDA
jgi:hypothetical protein